MKTIKKLALPIALVAAALCIGLNEYTPVNVRNIGSLFAFKGKSLEDPYIIASVAVRTPEGQIVGWWDYYSDGTKKWRPWPGTSFKAPFTSNDMYVVDLTKAKNKKRPAVKQFRS